MKPDDISTLRTIAEAIFQKEQRAIADIVAEESRIRRALARIDAANQTSAPSVDLAHSTSGAAAAWKVWMEQKRTQLNIHLAQTLVQKAERIAQVRTALGRQEALKMVEDKFSGPGKAD